MAGEDVEGAAHGREDGEIAAAEEAEDVEEELVGEDAEVAEATVPGIGGGIEEEEVAKRLDGERSGGDGGFKLEAHLLLLRRFLGLFAIDYLWFENWG